MSGAGGAGPTAESADDSDGPSATDYQTRLSGGLAGRRNLHVMSPRIASGGVPSGVVLGTRS